MTETWLPVVGFEGDYEVSDLGRVRSLLREPLVLKPWIDTKGYHRVILRGKNKRRVHRLVLEAFDRLPVGDEEGAHLNGDPGDNRPVNLAWKTPVGNSADSIRHGTLRRGQDHGAAKLSDDDVRRIRSARAAGHLWKEIHNDFPFVYQSTVIEAGTGVTFRHLDGACGPSARAIRVRHHGRVSSSGGPQGGN